MLGAAHWVGELATTISAAAAATQSVTVCHAHALFWWWATCCPGQPDNCGGWGAQILAEEHHHDVDQGTGGTDPADDVWSYHEAAEHPDVPKHE